jgi:hypothetical protein
VALYSNHAQLCEGLDPHDATYTVGPYQPSSPITKSFSNAAHANYDAKAFRPAEMQMANALDGFSHPWVRNKDRLDYGVPLPVKSGSSTRFFPDFLWWAGHRLGDRPNPPIHSRRKESGKAARHLATTAYRAGDAE